MGAYNMDSHHVQRYVTAEGFVRNEGDIQVRVRPYPVSYRSLTPKAAECTNLLVPVCLSASHIAYGSIRMEPVFMVLGQSAATAAVHAIEQRADVQAIDARQLQARLLADGQVLDFEPEPLPAATSAAGKKLTGIVVDDAQAELHGFDATSTAHPVFVGAGYRHDGNTGKGAQTARFTADLPRAGTYRVLLAYPWHANRASNVPVTIRHAGGETKIVVNEKQAPPVDGLLLPLGEFRFERGRAGSVEISNAGTDGYVVIDGVQWIESGAAP
jgi:hypothetical protein